MIYIQGNSNTPITICARPNLCSQWYRNCVGELYNMSSCESLRFWPSLGAEGVIGTLLEELAAFFETDRLTEEKENFWIDLLNWIGLGMQFLKNTACEPVTVEKGVLAWKKDERPKIVMVVSIENFFLCKKWDLPYPFELRLRFLLCTNEERTAEKLDNSRKLAMLLEYNRLIWGNE